MKINFFPEKLKGKLAYIAITIVIGVYLLHIFNVRFWNQGKGTIYWDTISYYAYLPAAFIHKDLSLEFIHDGKDDYGNQFWPETTTDGKFVIKTSMGLSFLYSPFFFAAHAYANLTDYNPNGFTKPYQVAMEFSSIFYLIFGLFFLVKILRRYFKEWVVAITILAIGLGTNLMAYTTREATMSHSFSFSLITIFIWLTIKWHERKGWGLSILTGLFFGLIFLIRPTNIVVFLIFIFYGISSVKDIPPKMKVLLSNWKWMLIIVIFTIIVWMPQFTYWKFTTGNWLFFSYTNDEGFFWAHPVIWKGLFGIRKGFFIYTPIMLFAMWGMFYLKKSALDFSMAVPLVFILTTYIILSWWTWWYGGSFGMRPYIDYYGLLAIPMAAFLQKMVQFRKLFRYLTISAFTLTFLLGIYFYIKYYYFSLHHDAMTWKAMKYSFFKIHPDGKYYQLLESPDYEKAKKERE